MKENIIRRRKHSVLLLLAAVFCFQVQETQARGVQARYLENSEMKSVLELTVEDPPPTSIIVQQHIPPGTGIRSASPAYSKFSPGKGKVKWLLKRPVPGVQKIVLQYATPLGAGRVTAVVRCKSPGSGELVTIHVQ